MAADQNGNAASGAAGGSQSDAMIDTSETSRGTQKVELDLDDAPFLEEEEEAAPEPQKPAAPTSLEAPPEKKSFLADRKKLIIIAAAALVLLIGVGVTVKLVFFKAKPAQVEQKAEHAEVKEQADNATETAPPEPPEVQVRLEPFWIEQKAANGEVRFLIVRMLIGTRDPAIAKELDAQRMAARNAVFYYLKNKDVQFLADEENAEKLKKELLLVINQYVTDGKFDTLMFEEYVVK